MTEIVVSDDVARQITSASLPIVIVDSNGRQLGQLNQVDSTETIPDGLTAEEWAEIVRRCENPGEYTTLEEIKKRHGWNSD